MRHKPELESAPSQAFDEGLSEWQFSHDEESKMSIEYGAFNRDGSRHMWVGDICIGKLMPSASQATLEASPGIQSWSSPRGKVATKMFDPDAVTKFNAQWSRNWAETYPLDTKATAKVVDIKTGEQLVKTDISVCLSGWGRKHDIAARKGRMTPYVLR
jgi:hypothetical protein